MKHPATGVKCPHCQQPAGSPCARPSEHYVFGGGVHRGRERLAVREGLMPDPADHDGIADDEPREHNAPRLF